MPRFTPQFLDELKARLRPSDVIGRYVKLKKQGNEWAGLSPFTNEKTPSFFVNDQKGFYHCFSSGNHGDVIKFLTDTRKLTFYEAVAQLAEETGMELPADDPQEAARDEKRKGLAEACGEAANYFSAMLRRADGRAGADYLQARGVTSEQLKAFRLGYAPESRAGLKDYLINKGYAEETLIEAGLLIKPEDGGASYDRFRGRVMFPITGARAAIIAFGGRALDSNARAKYLNSPETPLFHKGAVLYNLDPARAAAAEDKAPLIVCEGYMDVIGLWGAGVKRAVAPLGTALTENQLALLWRSSDEPLLCFDGDKAGVGAAFRAVDRALPILKPGKSLSFVFLPDGQDPDDLVKSGGASAFTRAANAALPLVDVLWKREVEARRLDTPEQRAALRSHLRMLAKSIADKDVRGYYGAELGRRLDEAFAPPARAQQRAGASQKPQFRKKYGRIDPIEQYFSLTNNLGTVRRPSSDNWAREATLVLAAVKHPALVERQEAAFLELELENPALQALLTEVLSAISADPGLDRDILKAHVHTTTAAETLERVLSDEKLNNLEFLRSGAEIDQVEWGWMDALRHHLIATNAKQEVADSASQSFTSGEDIWKAAVTAREELLNYDEGDEGTGRKSRENDVTTKDFLDRLERLRSSVTGKTGR